MIKFCSLYDAPSARSSEVTEKIAFKLLVKAEKRRRKLKLYKEIVELLKRGLYKDDLLLDIEGAQGRLI